MKTLWHLFIIRSLSKSQKIHEISMGGAVLSELYNDLMYTIFKISDKDEPNV